MLAYLRGPAMVSGWISTAAGGDPFMIMLLLVVLFVIVGDFIDAVPAIIIFMPIINKLTQVGNIQPLHMGVVIITTLVFGLITPPYGLSLLVASKYVGVGFGKAVEVRGREMAGEAVRLTGLRDKLWEGIRARVDEVRR